MAEAKKIPSNDYNVTLTLSREEAEALVALTGRVVTRPVTGAIYDALRNCGVQTGAYTVRDNLNNNHPTLHVEKANSNGC